MARPPRDWTRRAAASDVFSTTAERAAAGMVEPTVPSRPPFLTAPAPTLIAERGFTPWLGWGRFFYLAPDGNWRDTETNTAWQGQKS